MTPKKEAKNATGPAHPRLPRGVLLRVDVMRDAENDLAVYTRERLTPGSGDERNTVAILLFRTGLDVLNHFADEVIDSSKRPPPAGTTTAYRSPSPLKGESERLYG